MPLTVFATFLLRLSESMCSAEVGYNCQDLGSYVGYLREVNLHPAVGGGGEDEVKDSKVSHVEVSECVLGVVMHHQL